jgi:CDP-diacylglycerol pyrophosphatase
MLGEHEMHQKGVALEKAHKVLVALAIVLGILLAGVITAMGYTLHNALEENLALKKLLATCEQDKAGLASDLKYCRGINKPSGDAVLDSDGRPYQWKLPDSD